MLSPVHILSQGPPLDVCEPENADNERDFHLPPMKVIRTVCSERVSTWGLRGPRMTLPTIPVTPVGRQAVSLADT